MTTKSGRRYTPYRYRPDLAAACAARYGLRDAKTRRLEGHDLVSGISKGGQYRLYHRAGGRWERVA